MIVARDIVTILQILQEEFLNEVKDQIIEKNLQQTHGQVFKQILKYTNNTAAFILGD